MTANCTGSLFTTGARDVAWASRTIVEGIA